MYYIFEKVYKEGLGKIVRKRVCCKAGIVEIIGGVGVGRVRVGRVRVGRVGVGRVRVGVKYIE